MTSQKVQTVKNIFGGLDEDTAVDMKVLVENDAVLATNWRLIADDAVIEFATPYGGYMGDMAGPFQGADGLIAGWREWLEPWQSFLVRVSELIDADEDRVLLLADSYGRLSGSGVEIETPVAALYEVVDGTIRRISHYLDQQQARREAGLDPG